MTSQLSTLTDIIRLGAERYPDRVALQNATAGIVQALAHGQPASAATTYRELWDKAQRAACALRRRGFEREAHDALIASTQFVGSGEFAERARQRGHARRTVELDE